ncbi:hypothetical protein [Salibacterium sp. K-3]
MGKLKKIITLSIISMVVIFGGIFSYITFNPPLVKGSVGSINNYNAVLLVIGNKGFSDVHIDDVSVNGDEKPSKVKMQFSNPSKGFIVTDTFNQEAEDFNLHDIENVAIKTNTSPVKQREKADNDTAATDDKRYGISVVHDNQIENVTITYSYLGIPLEKTVKLDQ